MASYPLVSCVISTYKRADLLRRALRSVAVQTCKDLEVVCVHDGPVDKDTSLVWEEYGDVLGDRGIELNCVALGENSGYQCAPKNVGTHLARGSYIGYLDDDNEWTASHVEVLLEAIEPFPQVDCVYGRRTYVVDPGTDLDRRLMTGDSGFQPWDPDAIARMAAGPQGNFIDTSDALISKGSLWHLHAVTGCMWDEEKRRFADWELFARGMLAGWRFKGVDEIVQVYHWHGNNIQLTRPAREWMVQEELR